MTDIDKNILMCDGVRAPVKQWLILIMKQHKIL
jgi:hypothetical protein